MDLKLLCTKINIPLVLSFKELSELPQYVIREESLNTQEREECTCSGRE